MRYLIAFKGDFPNEPFITNWFDVENNFALGMIVYDLVKLVYTEDGIVWKPIAQDHL